MTYVVVSGPPGSGKTTLARPLAAALGLPLVAKDTVKEALADALGAASVEESRRLGAAAVAVLLAVAADSPAGAVLDCNFRRSFAAGELARLPGPVVEVFCRCPRALAAERYRSRARHPVHFDADRTDEDLWHPDVADPVAGGWPVVEVDTSGAVDVAALVAAIRGPAFEDQSAAFEDPGRHFGDPAVLDWLVANTPVEPGDLVLDVAAGTGLYGRALAPVAAAVVALDSAPGMLAAGQRAAAAQGLGNVVFQRGDAAALPFLDGSFDAVVSRLALHHVEDPAAVVAEMARVCRRGGTVAVVDLVVDAAVRDRFDHLERLRDPSHRRALTTAELVAAVEVAGATVRHRAGREQALDGERWLAQTATPRAPAAAIRAAWAAELAGGEATGMAPTLVDGRVAFAHRWELVAAAT